MPRYRYIAAFPQERLLEDIGRFGPDPLYFNRLKNSLALHDADANGIAQKPISLEAKRRLQAHPWPGNVRELENAMHRAVLLSVGDEIDAEAIRLPDGQPLNQVAPIGPDYVGRAAQVAESVARTFVGSTVAEVEQKLILDTLSHCLGNRTHAANILGISIRTLRNKLKEYSELGLSITAPQSGHAA